MKRFVSAPALRAALCAALLACGISNAAFAQTVPSPWTARDIGAPTLSGTATHSSGVFTVQVGGTDIWGSSDQFHFIYQAIAGDVEIVARVDSLTRAHRWTNAGVMIRGSLTAGSLHGYTAATADYGVWFRRRTSNGATSTGLQGPTTPAPVWVRLVRRGTLLTSYSSTNGTSWSTIGTQTMSLGSTAYVGLAVSSHNASMRTTAKFSNVRVTRLGLPAGQRSIDIGAPVLRGSATFTNGTYTVKAAGKDIWDTADQFHFVYQQVTGNTEVIARVATIGNTDVWSKAGVMIRESLTASSKHAMVVTSASKGYAFQRRPEVGAYSEHTSGGAGTAPAWVRLVRTGDLFEAYRSSGSTWTKIGSDTIPMNDTVYVGLAATSHNTSALATDTFDNVRIVGGTSSNSPPSVSITAPASGTTVNAPTTISITATASDPEGRMASVDFYAGSTLISRDTTAPYSASWSASAAGTYPLTAVAHDADGNRSISGTVSVAVTTSSMTAPPKAVAFTASADHATKVTKYVLKIYAATSSTTGTPLAASDLGKPTPASNGDITVDRATFFNALAVGSYKATVTAVGSTGETASAAISFTR